MSKRTRKHPTVQGRVVILRLHLLKRTPVSDLYDQYGIRLMMFYRWQKELFENGAAVFDSFSTVPIRIFF